MIDLDSYFSEEDDGLESRTEFFKRWPKLKETYVVFFERTCESMDYTQDLEFKDNLSDEIEAKLKGEKDDGIPKKRFRRSFTSFLKEEIENSAYDEDVDEDRLPYMIFDELTSYYVDNSETSLTTKYYALRAFKELRQKHLSPMHTNHPEDEESNINWFEKEMTFISAFFHQEQITLSFFVSSELDDLAEQVRDLLTEKHPSNTLLKHPQYLSLSYHRHGFLENRFSDEETREILDCQCELFKKLGFKVVNDNDKDLMDIWEALETKKGNWPVIFAIFMGVAQRLGVRCRILRIRGLDMFDLGWKSLPDEDGDESEEAKERANNNKFFALNIFECTKSQHEEVSCREEQIWEIFQSIVIYERIPRVTFGELRSNLLSIIDFQSLAPIKYQLNDSSDEDERCSQFHRSEEYYNFSSDEEYVNEYDSPDSDEFGYSYGLSNKKTKKKTDKIALDKSKLIDKLTEISKRSQAYETRLRLKRMEKMNKKLKEENDLLKSQASKENEPDKKE